MKVLVTGAAGFLGSWLVEALLDQGCRVVGIDNMIGGYEDNITSHDRYQFARLDLLDLGGITDFFSGCDAVYHCGALPYEGLSVFSPSIITENIVVGSVNVMVASVRCGVRRVINCSSMSRYGSIPVPYVEEQVLQPVDPYGLAKFMAEKQMDLIGQIYGIKLVHAIPHNIIGAKQKYDDPFRNVASIMANLMLQGRRPIVYGDGEQVRCFSAVQDVVPILIKMLDYEVDHGEVFNVGPDKDPVTINELVRRLCRVIGVCSEPIYHGARPQEVKTAFASSDKIRRVFSYQEKVGLDESLGDIVQYIRGRGVRPFCYHMPVEIVRPDTPRTWCDQLF